MGNFDGGWKLAVTRFLRLFMKLLFHDAYAQIDWKRGFVALDKELEALFPKGKSGRKHVDLLFKVWLIDGRSSGSSFTSKSRASGWRISNS